MTPKNFKNFIKNDEIIDETKITNKNNNSITEKEKNILPFENKFETKNNQRILDYISFAKIISSYGVIALHLNHFWSFNISKKKRWIIENFYETFFYYSVPFFVLCIGATLLDFNERYGFFEYNRRRIIKVFIPLLGWTIILYFYKVYILKNLSKISFNFSTIWNYFFESKIYGIFNSLHIFLLTYMLIPLLAFVEKSNKIKIYTYYFFLLLITQAFIPYLINLLEIKIVWIYKLNIGYLIYIFAGYIIHNHIFSKFTKTIIYVLGFLSFLIHLIGTKVLTFRYNRIKKLHKGYLNLPCIFYSCSLFLLVKENCYIITKIINKKFINKIGSLTLGPFFMHLTVRETISKFSKFKNLIDFNLLLYSLIVFSICIFLSFILKKIPLIKILVP